MKLGWIQTLLLPAIAWGAPAHHAQTGEVASYRVVEEGRSGLVGPTDETFGVALAAIGDLDGDGTVDLAVGDPGDDTAGTNRGAVWLLFQNPDGSVKSEHKIVPETGGFTGPPSNGAGLGAALAYLGDLDGDGNIELAVGAYDFFFSYSSPGEVWILSLTTTGSVVREVRIADGVGGFTPVNSPAYSFGDVLGAPGDVDGDGIPDLAVGNPSGLNGGGIYLLFLNADGTVRAFQKNNNAAGGATKGTLPSGRRIGISIGGVGDFDGDGTPDLVAGISENGLALLTMGTDGKALSQVRIENGSAGFPAALTSGTYATEFGRAVTDIGDLDQNGVTDLAVGTYSDEIWILFLEPTGDVKGCQRIRAADVGLNPGPGELEEFGRSLANLGDLDGDGRVELAAGARRSASYYVLTLDDSGFLPPIADFSGSPGEPQVNVPRVIDFQDRSRNNVSSWSWDLDDGETSTQAEVLGQRYSGSTNRSVAVTLTVTGLGGSDSTTRTFSLEEARNTTLTGAGLNPPCFSLAAANLGQIMKFTVTPSRGGFTSVSAKLALFHAAPSQGMFFNGWEVLVDLASPLFHSFLTPDTYFGPSYFTLGTVPNELTLIGSSLAAQGGFLGTGGLVLCNGVEVVVGW